MYNDVVKYIRECDVCQRYTLGPRNLQKFRLPLKSPFDMVGIDIVGPLPKTYNGNRYIIVATDYLTRWTCARPVKTKTAFDVAKFIVEEIFTNHGPPRKLVSDQGKEFLNHVIKKICLIMDTKKIYTSPYNPKCNGVVERVNKTLIGKLSKMVNQRWKEWDEFLVYALYAYRITPRNNGISPFELLNGRKPGKMSQEEIEIEEADELVIERLNNLREMLIKEEREIKRIKNGRNVEDLEINDFVRRRKLSINKENKLDNKFEDICRIIGKGQRGSYEIEDIIRRKSTVSRKDLIKFEGSDPDEWSDLKKGGMSQDTFDRTWKVTSF